MVTETCTTAEKLKTQSWGQGTSGRDSPERPRTATGSPSATQAGSTLLMRHLDQAGPMGVLLQEQNIPGAVAPRGWQGLEGPTVVTSHQQIPNSISRIAFNFAFFYTFLSGQMLDLGARYTH